MAGAVGGDARPRLIEAGAVVLHLARAMVSTEGGLKSVPGLLKRVLREKLWRKRTVSQTGKPATFERFEKFVSDRPPEGLGSDLASLKNLCRDDTEALDLIDQATKKGGGNPTGANQHAEGGRGGTVDIINGSSRPDGTSRQQALRRLRKDRPDLHKRVLAEELSAHAAMVEAGFRKVPAQPEVCWKAWLKCSEKERKGLLAKLREGGWIP